MIIVENSNGKKTTLDTIIEKAAEEEIEVVIDERITGKKIIKVLKENREYYLNSIYGGELAEYWCNQCELKGFGTVVVLFGIANGEYIEKIKERNKDASIILYEPSYSILYGAIQCIGTENFDKKTENIFLCVGKDGLSDLYNTMDTVIGYENIKNVRMMISPNYELIMRRECEEFKELFNQRLLNIEVNKNTIKRFGQEFLQNTIDNISDYVHQYGLGDLKEAFEKIDLEGIPAVVVAAGPSLDKNIKELKNIKGKAFIISVDTALKSLAKEDIVPDIAVTVDPHKPIGLFDHEKINHVPLVYALGANADIKQVHHGMRIYENSTNSILDGFIYKLEKRVLRLSTGGSVANDAFSLARELGFKTVILIGLDLAYPYNKMHTEGAYGKDADNKIKESDTHYIQVEDIYGNMVRTEENMNIYRQWFEREADLYPDIRIIDATEGGAKKKGMEILTLRDALKRECKNDEGLDFQRVIGELAPYFNAEERSEIIDYLNNIDFHMEALRKKMREGIKAYDKLDELNRKQKYTGKEFTGAIEKITEINNLVSDNKEMEYLQLYVAEEDYQLREVVFEEKDNLYEDIRHMANNGKKLVNSIIDATYEIERDMKLAAEKTNINI